MSKRPNIEELNEFLNGKSVPLRISDEEESEREGSNIFFPQGQSF